MLKTPTLLVVSLLLPDCFGSVATLTPQAGGVTLVRDSDRPLHCKFLAKINGTSRSSDEKVAREGAENDFRNHAAELNANFAVAEVERPSRVGTSGEQDFFIGGTAQLCQTEAMEEAKDKADADAEAQQEKADEAQKEKADADLKAQEQADKKAKNHGK